MVFIETNRLKADSDFADCADKTTAAADRMTDRIAQLVFVDTGPLPDGVAQEEFNPPQERERNAAVVADHGEGWRLPPPPVRTLPKDGPGASAPTPAPMPNKLKGDAQ